jgi:hypothetical protein
MPECDLRVLRQLIEFEQSDVKKKQNGGSNRAPTIRDY